MSYATDTPEAKLERDRLKRGRFVQQIVHTVTARTETESLTIGIYGAWGTGKTTVLNFIASELGPYQDVVCKSFNPWRFSSEDQLLLEFFRLLVQAVGQSLETERETRIKTVEEYLSYITPAFGEVGTAVEKAAHRFSTFSVEEARARVADILKEAKKRVVITIDDIDRLDLSEIQAVFKLVKLTADFPYTTYILAFDEERVAEALSTKYGSVEGGRSFLEKIVQVPLHIPPADTIALRTLCLEGVQGALAENQLEVAAEQQEHFVNTFIRGSEIRLTIPRMGKRYVNALIFSLPILKGEVNVVDLMLIEGIRILYPEMYTLIRDNPHVFLGTYRNTYAYLDQAARRQDAEEYARQLIRPGWDGLTADEVAALREVLSYLFPQVVPILSGRGFAASNEQEERWAEAQRLCSSGYFRRYFTYAIQDYEVSDQELNNVIVHLGDLTRDELAAELRRLVELHTADEVINRLRLKAKLLSENNVGALVMAIMHIAEAFPRPDIFWFSATAFFQAAAFVAELIRQTNPASQFDLAQHVMQDSPFLPFAMECYRFFHADKDTEQYRIFSDDQQQTLRGIIAERVRKLALHTLQEPLYVAFPKDAGLLFQQWAQVYSRAETDGYIKRTVADDPNNAILLLKCFCGISYSSTGGSPMLRFDQRNYDNVALFVDPAAIYEALYTIYGTGLKNVEGASVNFMPVQKDSDLALHFAQYYFRSQGERRADERVTPP